MTRVAVFQHSDFRVFILSCRSVSNFFVSLFSFLFALSQSDPVRPAPVPDCPGARHTFPGASSAPGCGFSDSEPRPCRVPPRRFALGLAHVSCLAPRMWCCWCLDSEPSPVPDPGPGSNRGSSRRSNRSQVQNQTGPGQSCSSCGGAFSNTQKKHVCVDCGLSYCSTCSARLEPRPRLCHTCQRFYGNLLQRAELMRLKVKELRDYLHLHHVSTHLCREKEDLVELVMGHQSSSEASTPDSTPPPLITATETHAPPTERQIPPTETNTLPAERQAPPTESQTTPTETQAPPTDVQAPPTDAQVPPIYAEDLPPEPSTIQSESLEDEDEEEEQIGPRRRASLSDLSCEDDVEKLSVRRLKEILARNFVDFKGCCEKWELMERVRRLYRDKSSLQQEGGAAAADELLCRICMDSPIDCVLLECGHMITCTQCGKRMSECPICRQYVVRAVHVFRS
ncbi:E3 ubiquitin-protein ligase rififylin-like [Eucyclogobius newberryi]|uniref:E3 ubiquitin-protein ligase rififylin-like n=1 Tax=Eucyclogobius newberryi TaxID=166745 RepID=UPI003B5BA0A3